MEEYTTSYTLSMVELQCGPRFASLLGIQVITLCSPQLLPHNSSASKEQLNNPPGCSTSKCGPALSFIKLAIVIRMCWSTVPGNKDENCPTSSFKQMPISPFTITTLCGAQSTLHSCVISINHAKFHSPKTKTPYIMNFFN
jgi:hypothetical protein